MDYEDGKEAVRVPQLVSKVAIDCAFPVSSSHLFAQSTWQGLFAVCLYAAAMLNCLCSSGCNLSPALSLSTEWYTLARKATYLGYRGRAFGFGIDSQCKLTSKWTPKEATLSIGQPVLGTWL